MFMCKISVSNRKLQNRKFLITIIFISQTPQLVKIEAIFFMADMCSSTAVELHMSTIKGIFYVESIFLYIIYFELFMYIF